MTDIDLPHLMKLLDCDSPHDCWLSDDCIIDDTGIRVKPLDKQTEDILIGDEWSARKEYEKDIKLDLPCTHEELIIWAQQNDFAYNLPGLIPFTEAQQLLESRLEATADEMVMWIAFKELTAFRSKLPSEARKFTFEIHKFYQGEKFKNELLKLFFIKDEIEQFQPAKCYINRIQLVERWSGFFKNGDFTVDDFITAKAESGDLPEYHPITGIVETDGELFKTGLFDLNDVVQIETDNLLRKDRQQAIAEIKASRVTEINRTIEDLLTKSWPELVKGDDKSLNNEGLLKTTNYNFSFQLHAWKQQLNNWRIQKLHLALYVFSSFYFFLYRLW